MQKRVRRVGWVLGLAALVAIGLIPSGGFAEEEESPPRTERETRPPVREEPEEAPTPPRDFRPSEEVPFDMGIDFPVDI